MTEHHLVVPPDLSGMRVDKFLAVSLDLGRGHSRTIIDAGNATIDGRAVSPSDRVASGEQIHVVVPEVDRHLAPDATVQFGIVHEDRDLVVVDKPVGLVVHPTSANSTSTLVHGLLERYPDIRGVGQEGRWGIVHRLDRDTSGLLVVARTHDAYGALVDMMKHREITRRYLAVVVGSLPSTRGTIDAPIGRDPRHPTQMRIDRAGKPARTHYRRLAAWDAPDRTLVSVTLETGRTHQIRIHMLSIDHAIVGDIPYGGAPTADSPGRPWLHARELSFSHPMTGAAIDCIAGIPRDLTDSLRVLGEPSLGAAADVDGTPL